MSSRICWLMSVICRPLRASSRSFPLGETAVAHSETAGRAGGGSGRLAAGNVDIDVGDAAEFFARAVRTDSATFRAPLATRAGDKLAVRAARGGRALAGAQRRI